MQNLNKKGKPYSGTALKNLPNEKQDTSSIQVKHLTKSEIESLRQNKRDAYAQMLKMN